MTGLRMDRIINKFRKPTPSWHVVHINTGLKINPPRTANGAWIADPYKKGQTEKFLAYLERFPHDWNEWTGEKYPLWANEAFKYVQLFSFGDM